MSNSGENTHLSSDCSSRCHSVIRNWVDVAVLAFSKALGRVPWHWRSWKRCTPWRAGVISGNHCRVTFTNGYTSSPSGDSQQLLWTALCLSDCTRRVMGTPGYRPGSGTAPVPTVHERPTQQFPHSTPLRIRLSPVTCILGPRSITLS